MTAYSASWLSLWRLLLLPFALACNRGQYVGMGTAADTVRLPVTTQVGKIKAGTVIMQAGTSNVASQTDNTKAGQRGGAAATAPQAVATATTKKGTVPAWVFVLVGLLSVIGWEYASRYVPQAFLPWRGRPS